MIRCLDISSECVKRFLPSLFHNSILSETPTNRFKYFPIGFPLRGDIWIVYCRTPRCEWHHRVRLLSGYATVVIQLTSFFVAIFIIWSTTVRIRLKFVEYCTVVGGWSVMYVLYVWWNTKVRPLDGLDTKVFLFVLYLQYSLLGGWKEKKVIQYSQVKCWWLGLCPSGGMFFSSFRLSDPVSEHFCTSTIASQSALTQLQI